VVTHCVFSEQFFGRQPNDPFTRYPYLQFMRDSRTLGDGVIVGQPGFDTLLDQNKQAYAEQIVASSDFNARFPAAPAAVYVDALFASAGVTPPDAERTAAIMHLAPVSPSAGLQPCGLSLIRLQYGRRT
jgi:hypothetical protein